MPDSSPPPAPPRTCCERACHGFACTCDYEAPSKSATACTRCGKDYPEHHLSEVRYGAFCEDGDAYSPPPAPSPATTSATVRLTCEGSSDDTFGVYGAGPDNDHDNCASGKPITFRVSAGEDSLLVVGQYAPGQCGGWLIGVAPDGTDADGDDNEIPDWPMRFTRSDRAYSPQLVIEAPLGVEVKHVD